MQSFKKIMLMLFVFIALMLPVYGDTALSGYIGTQNGGFGVEWAGLLVQINTTITITSVERMDWGSDRPTQCAIFDDGGVLLINASYVGNVCTIPSYVVTASEGSEVNISFVSNKNGADWNGAMTGVIAFPTHTTVARYIGYVYTQPEILDGTNYAYEIYAFNYTLGSPPPPASTNSELKYFVDGNPYTNETFEEGEDFVVKLNLTYDGEESNASQCNITFVEGIVEFESSEDSFLLCDSGCNFNNYSFEIEIPSDTIIDDVVYFDVCHEQVANQDLRIDSYCPALTDTHIISNTEFILCSEGFTSLSIDVNGCETEENINITFSNNANVIQRHNISDIAFDREYQEHTDIYLFNETSRFYENTTHTHEYYKHGVKDIFVNCTNSTAAFNEAFNITISNIPPVIDHPFIIIDNIIYPFTDLMQIFATSLSNITIVETIIDDDLKNHTSYLTNSTTLLWSANTSTPVDFHTTFIAMGNFTLNDTYNWTTIADDGTDRSNLTTRFVFNLTNNIAPVIIINTTIGFVFDTGDVRINYTPLDLQNMKNCTFNSNITGIDLDNFVNFSINANEMSYFESSVNAGTFRYSIGCTDIFGLTGYSANQTFIVTGEPSPYNVNLLKNTNWFNTEVINLTTTAGVFIMFFILALVVGMVTLSEVTGVGALMSLTGIVIGFFGWLIYVSISVIIGIFIIILGLGYILRGVFNEN